jgi:hypothetical protein
MGPPATPRRLGYEKQQVVRFPRSHFKKIFPFKLRGHRRQFQREVDGTQRRLLDMSYFKAEEQVPLAEYRKAIQGLTIYAGAVDDKTWS